MPFKTIDEINDVVRKFENCTIARGTWGHPEHLVLAYHYAANNDPETALNKMRDGIYRLLKSFEIDLSKEMPYHETLTVFWMKTVFEYSKTKNGYSVEIINEMIKRFDKDYPLRFYSKEHLFSDRARAKYVEPDKSFETE